MQNSKWSLRGLRTKPGSRRYLEKSGGRSNLRDCFSFDKLRIAMTEQGFTLIELVVVLAFVSIISTVGIAGYMQYSRVQKLNSASLDFATVLQTAKSRALSQVKPDSGACNSSDLNGYQVYISSSTAFQTLAKCADGTVDSASKTLPLNISFSLPNSAASATIFFNVLTGLVTVTVGVTNINIDSGYIITLNSSENSSIHKTVTVYANGRIIVN